MPPLPSVPGELRVTKENSCMISDLFSQHLKYKYAKKGWFGGLTITRGNLDATKLLMKGWLG